MTKAIVIGAGLGGMAAALRLRARGYEVTVIDRCEQPGGRAQVFHRGGFVFDAGPTVITAPFLLEELYALFGKKLSDYTKLVPLKPWYRFYFPDGDTFDYGGSLEETLEEIGRISPQDRAGYLALLAESKAIFDIGFSQLADQPFHRFFTMMGQLPNLIRLRCHRSVWDLVTQHLQHEKLRQAFSIQPLLVGGNPFATTCIYSLIHYLERKWGIYFAMGGMGALISGLHTLMTEVGINVHLGTTVTGLAVKKRNIHQLSTADGRQFSAQLFVANCDPDHLYRHLLPARSVKVSAKLKGALASRSMGLFVLYFGTRKKYETLAHHTIWLGKRYRSLLDEIFNCKTLPEDFSLYLHRPTATDPDMAPVGCDTFYVLAPVPNLAGGVDWNQERQQYGDKIIKALEDSIMPGLSSCIVERFEMTPQEFQSDYLSPAGDGFSIAPTLQQSAWFRYHNRGEGPDNLFLVGAGTHPGAGLPGVLSSAKVLENLLPETAPATAFSSGVAPCPPRYKH